MSSFTTADPLLDRVRRSGLVLPAELDAFLATRPAGGDLLAGLVAERHLTPFQAAQLAAGKYKGFRLGQYVILAPLGAGGAGQVFLAEHSAMRRLVALKVLLVPRAADSVNLERFLREARAAATLNHPNIVRVFDLNQDGRVHYLVMEYVEGVNLDELVRAAGPVPPAAAADYARQVAAGLQHAHQRSLVHRDVKPANVLVDRAGGVQLLDLGLVRYDSEHDSQLTFRSGDKSILGTADFLAPEQAVDSSAVDTRADVYGLGATLYYMLAGRTLFPDGRTSQKLMWQQWRTPDPIQLVRPEVPDGLAAVVAKALAKWPDDRFQTPGEFEGGRWPRSSPARARRRPSVPPVPPRRWPVAKASGLTPSAPRAEFRTPPPSRFDLPAGVAVPAASSPVVPPTRPRAVLWVVAGALLLAAAAVLFWR
ncbi:MAG: serine/threonine-protein kinase [Gemmataceae bacterium]